MPDSGSLLDDQPLFLSVIVPAYNEEKRIGSTLLRMVEYFDSQSYRAEILVVDDGSTDQTRAVVESIKSDRTPISFLHYDGNRGKGFAVRFGMLRGEGNLVLFSDADLATPIEEVEHLMSALNDRCEVAIGSRDVKGAKLEKRQSIIREFGGKLFNRLVRWMAVPGIHDTQCGFKLFTRSAARNIFSRCQVDNFSFDVEALHLAREMGYEISEVPVCWHHVEGSKVSLQRDALRMLFTLWKIRATDYRIKHAKTGQASTP